MDHPPRPAGIGLVLPLKKVVYLTPPAHGHLNPTLPVMRELDRRGIQVTCYNTEEFRSQVESDVREFLRKEYRPGGTLGYLRWTLTSGRISKRTFDWMERDLVFAQARYLFALRLAIRIVGGALHGIGQHRVGPTDLVEAQCVAALDVGMAGLRQVPESGLHLGGVGIRREEFTPDSY